MQNLFSNTFPPVLVDWPAVRKVFQAAGFTILFVTDNQSRTKREKRIRRVARIFVWSAGVFFVLLLIALHMVARFFEAHDAPERLGGQIHIMETNGFTLRWVDKR